MKITQKQLKLMIQEELDGMERSEPPIEDKIREYIIRRMQQMNKSQLQQVVRTIEDMSGDLVENGRRIGVLK